MAKIEIQDVIWHSYVARCEGDTEMAALAIQGILLKGLAYNTQRTAEELRRLGLPEEIIYSVFRHRLKS